eukprot:gene946-260_t
MAVEDKAEEGATLPKIIKSWQEKVDSEDDFDFEWSYHKTWYKRLCDEEKIRRGEAKKRNTTDSSKIKETDDDGGAGGDDVDLLSYSAPIRQLTRLEMKKSNVVGSRAAESKQRNAFVLPERCRICMKGSNWFQSDKRSGKRKRVPLMMCETEDAGKLCHAAQLKNDEKILLQIRGQDCAAIEGYRKFCSDVIEKKIMHMTTLYEKFLVIVKDEGNVNASSFRQFRLKDRLFRGKPGQGGG